MKRRAFIKKSAGGLVRPDKHNWEIPEGAPFAFGDFSVVTSRDYPPELDNRKAQAGWSEATSIRRECRKGALCLLGIPDL